MSLRTELRIPNQVYALDLIGHGYSDRLRDALCPLRSHLRKARLSQGT